MASIYSRPQCVKALKHYQTFWTMHVDVLHAKLVLILKSLIGLEMICTLPWKSPGWCKVWDNIFSRFKGTSWLIDMRGVVLQPCCWNAYGLHQYICPTYMTLTGSLETIFILAQSLVIFFVLYLFLSRLHINMPPLWNNQLEDFLGK